MIRDKVCKKKLDYGSSCSEVCGIERVVHVCWECVDATTMVANALIVFVGL